MSLIELHKYIQWGLCLELGLGGQFWNFNKFLKYPVAGSVF